jgi:hypothetical protein
MKGKKTGGRTAGVPNKRTVELTERLAALGCDPLAGLVQITADPTAELALRAKVLSDLLPYMYPKRKALELSPKDDDRDVTWTFRWADSPKTEEAT